MQVSFEVLTPQGAIGESDLLSRWSEFREWLATTSPECIVILYNDSGSRRVRALRDDMQFLLPALCFDVATELAAGRSTEISLIGMDYTMQFVVEGAQVVVSAPGGEPDHCDRMLLVAALVACGDRFIDMWEKLHGDDQEQGNMLASWKVAAAKSRAAIG